MGCGCAERRAAIKAAWQRVAARVMRNDQRPALMRHVDREQLATEARISAQEQIKQRQQELRDLAYRRR